MLRLSGRALLLVAGSIALLPVSAIAQGPQPGGSPPSAAVATYKERFDEVWKVGPSQDKSAEVKNLVLQREGGTFELNSGQLTLLTPIDGKVIGAEWNGSGRFKFEASIAAERDRTQHYFGSSPLDIPITGLVIFFSDSTAVELSQKLKLGPRPVGQGEEQLVHKALEFFSDDDTHEFDVDLMSLMLGSNSNGVFYAAIARPGADAIGFVVNGNVRDGVRLMSRSRNAKQVPLFEGVVRVPRATESRFPSGEQRVQDIEVRHYAVDVTIPNSMTGDVSFAAKAQLTLAGDQTLSGWVPFSLYPKMKVDSATWADGEAAAWFRQKDSELLWVRLPRTLPVGDSLFLSLVYHGDLTDRFGDWFAIKSSTAWYPWPMEERSKATFDLTFHAPKNMTLVSVGDLKDSSVTSNMRTTHWVTPGPIRNAAFNFGIFESHTVAAPGIPTVTVLWSEMAHRAFAQAAVQQTGMDKKVAGDVGGALQFFQQMYGPPPTNNIYATEIPYSHGEAFPGLVHLWYGTFISTLNDGSDEQFRAHEVAHQWWGIGVDYSSYRDRWLSEGFADFSGLWFMQVARKDPAPYFAMLRTWKTQILDRSSKVGPISIGHRVQDSKDYNDYQIIVYEKGAWVLHMLRTLMLDMKTMRDDRFEATMQDFYTTYKGGSASTEDFQRMVEKHVGQPMGWFFDEWVRGTAIPTYNVSWTINPLPQNKYQVHLKVVQQDVPETFQMYVPVTVQLADGGVMRVRVLVKGAGAETDLPPVDGKPKAVIFNDLEGVLAKVNVQN